MLLKHPHCVDTIRKMRRYKTTVAKEAKNKQLRQVANEIYDKYKVGVNQRHSEHTLFITYVLLVCRLYSSSPTEQTFGLRSNVSWRSSALALASCQQTIRNC